MVAYGIGITPMTKNMKAEFPDITKPWYDDNTDALSMFARVGSYFNSLQQHGPGRGY